MVGFWRWYDVRHPARPLVESPRPDQLDQRDEMAAVESGDGSDSGGWSEEDF